MDQARIDEVVRQLRRARAMCRRMSEFSDEGAIALRAVEDLTEGFNQLLAVAQLRSDLAAGPDAPAGPTVRACRECGCTEEDACPDAGGDPCAWVETDLCSACVPVPDPQPAS